MEKQIRASAPAVPTTANRGGGEMRAPLGARSSSGTTGGERCSSQLAWLDEGETLTVCGGVWGGPEGGGALTQLVLLFLEKPDAH